METSERKQHMDVSGVDTDNPTRYLKALFGDSSTWNEEILFPDLDQEYCEVEGSPLDVSYASTVDNQSEVGKTDHVMHTSQSGRDADMHKSTNQTYPFTPTKGPEPYGTIIMEQACATQYETGRHCGTEVNDTEAIDVYFFQEAKATTVVPLPTTCPPLPTTNPPLPTVASLTTDVDIEGVLPTLSGAVGTPGSLIVQLHGNPVQTQHPMLQNPDQLPASFTDGAQDVQTAAGPPIQDAIPWQLDLSDADLADILQWIQKFEPTYQPNPPSGAATASGIPGIPDENLPPLSGAPTTDSMMEPGSTIVGSTTDPFTTPRTQQSVVMGAPTSSPELSEIKIFPPGSTFIPADTHIFPSQMMVDPDMDLADLDVLCQKHADQSSHLGDIPFPEPEVISVTAVAAPGVPTNASVKQGLKSKIQLKRHQRGEKELMVSFVSQPPGELTEEEKQKIDLRKKRNKDSANRSRLNRQMKMKKLMQENAEAEKELEMLKSEVEKSRKVRDVLQYWWERRLCHVTTGFRKPPFHMGVNDLLDALEKYLASEAKV
ncbi:uncharacterized protein [Haliotis asinina]|uniref:uncharacterized protein n=1 Tax=Haliotis asinina TaxID=109174 RepID=UPI0035319EA6